ncbi:PilZ domain-containing protein [Sphingomonas sp. Tas61C01]|uniref:PilZ domain-containing protein n=1 Tax=Sphingomonas sp. Tas61C01 TaxID=3458297 RepID=UPI00403EB82B
MDSFNRDPIADRSPAGSAQRPRKRDSLFLTARLTFVGTTDNHEVRVRNLSEGGMMAEVDRVVDAATPVTLELRGIGEVTGRIAWCTEGRVGIAFDHPIDPKKARKPVGQGSRTPVYATPVGLGPRHRGGRNPT